MRDFVNTWKRVRNAEDGATATEYVVLLVFIALAIFIGAGLLGGGLNSIFKSSCEELATQANANLKGDPAQCTN